MTTKEDKNDYSKGLIYKIKCLDPKIRDIYVGSTLNEVARRKSHKSNCTNPKGKKYNRCVYQFIRSNGGWENWKLCLIKLYPCNSRTELRMEEERMIEELEEFTTLNRIRAYLSEETRKEYHKEYHKEYYEENREQKKKYYKEHKEEIRKKHKKYYETYKEEIAEKQKEKYTCDCGSTLTKQHKTRHEKTQKHEDYLESLT